MGQGIQFAFLPFKFPKIHTIIKALKCMTKNAVHFRQKKPQASKSSDLKMLYSLLVLNTSEILYTR